MAWFCEQSAGCESCDFPLPVVVTLKMDEQQTGAIRAGVSEINRILVPAYLMFTASPESLGKLEQRTAVFKCGHALAYALAKRVLLDVVIVAHLTAWALKPVVDGLQCWAGCLCR